MSEEIKRRGVPDTVIAEQYGLSVAFLKKDRATKRSIPFFRIGDLIRYDPERVHAALLLNEEGGPQKTTRRRAQAATAGA